MTDSSTPKGPILPGTGKSDPSKTGNKVISIGSEKVTDSPKIKEKKRAHRQERDKRKAKRSASKAEPAEKAKSKTTQETTQKKGREKHNDERIKEKNRQKQQTLVKFRVDALPKRTRSEGKNATALPQHPLTVKMTGDSNVTADTTVNERAKQERELQLKHQHQHRLQHQATHTQPPPTPKPPGM